MSKNKHLCVTTKIDRDDYFPIVKRFHEPVLHIYHGTPLRSNVIFLVVFTLIRKEDTYPNASNRLRASKGHIGGEKANKIFLTHVAHIFYLHEHQL